MQYGHTETLDTHVGVLNQLFPQKPVEVSRDDPLQNLPSLFQVVRGREEYFLKHTIYRTNGNRVAERMSLS